MQKKVPLTPDKCQCCGTVNPQFPTAVSPFCVQCAGRKRCPAQSPLSGYEPVYMPRLYNKKAYVQHNHNCFAYAFDIMDLPTPEECNGNDKDECKVPFHQPGYFSGQKRFDESGEKRCFDLFSRLKGDMPAIEIARNGRPIEFTDKCAKGYSKIALVIDPKQDYHFYRQDSNGFWSHKPGGTAVTNRDSAGRLIYNPELANRDSRDDAANKDGLNYNVFCGFMCVPRTLPNRAKRGGSRRRKTRRLVGGMNRLDNTPESRIGRIKDVLRNYYSGINSNSDFEEDFKQLIRDYKANKSSDIIKKHIRRLVDNFVEKIKEKNLIAPESSLRADTIRSQIYSKGVLPRTKKNTTQRVAPTRGLTRSVKVASRTASRKAAAKKPASRTVRATNMNAAKAAAKKAAANARELRALRRAATQLVEAAKKPRRARKAPTGGPGGPVEPENPVAAATERVVDVIARTGATEEVVEKAMQKAVRRRVPGINNNNNNNNNMGAPAPPTELDIALSGLLDQHNLLGGPRIEFLPAPVISRAAPFPSSIAPIAPGMRNSRAPIREGWGGEANVDDLIALATSGLDQLGL